jgi:hypothetical protein
MAKVTTYEIDRLEGSIPSSLVASEREGVFQLTDADWRLVFRDSGRGLSCGLLRSELKVEPVDRRLCRVSIADSSTSGSTGSFNTAVVLNARPNKVRSDLARRLESLKLSGEVMAAVGAGQWWRDSEVFDSLDWSHNRSIAGVQYRAGWWGTGSFKPSMLPKVLDFGPRGVAFRGWRTRFVIPWDTITAIKVLDGDCWLVEGLEGERRSPLGTTLAIRSPAGQDAVFYTPLQPPAAVRALLEPLTDSLDRVEVDDQLRRTGLWQGSYWTSKVDREAPTSEAQTVDNRAFPELA